MKKLLRRICLGVILMISVIPASYSNLVDTVTFEVELDTPIIPYKQPQSKNIPITRKEENDQQQSSEVMKKLMKAYHIANNDDYSFVLLVPRNFQRLSEAKRISSKNRHLSKWLKFISNIPEHRHPGRRTLMRPHSVWLGTPSRPEHLPAALPIHPGHTLLRPSAGMLKSSVKYPLRDFKGSPVYGNLDNLGITFGKTRQRIRYSDFRKANNFLHNRHRNSVWLGTPSRPEHLPAALPIHPGHTLLRPSAGMLKSSVKYPLRDFQGSPVYGNLDNLGITFGKTRQRIRYTDFRKANNFLKNTQNAIQASTKRKKRSHPLMIFEIDPSEIKAMELQNQMSTINNNAKEILDDSGELFAKDSNQGRRVRRSALEHSRERKVKTKRSHRHRGLKSRRSGSARKGKRRRRRPQSRHRHKKNNKKKKHGRRKHKRHSHHKKSRRSH